MLEEDRELIDRAKQVISLNYDEKNENHTVGCAVRCIDGEIYTGVNMYSLHGACAEVIAVGTAVSNGKREFKSIVAVRGRRGEEILAPCGNCRQFLNDYAPNCEVILPFDRKVRVAELLPHAYEVKY